MYIYVDVHIYMYIYIYVCVTMIHAGYHLVKCGSCRMSQLRASHHSFEPLNHGAPKCHPYQLV